MILVIPPTAIETAENRLAGDSFPAVPATFSIGPILSGVATECLGRRAFACTRSRNFNQVRLRFGV